VTPIATATNTPGKPIKVGVRPSAIAITPDGKTAYVANLLSDTVTPIATATNTPGRTIGVPRLPEAIAITPDGKTAYVAVWDGVTSIDTATNTRGRLIRVGTGSIRGIAAIVVTPRG
jgi:YVTN family beta-propeller protein